jgi:hypothetical protein
VPASPTGPQSGCPGAQVCFNAANDSPAGICVDDGRGPVAQGWDPWCRSDGQGACREECFSDGSCQGSDICMGGFCHAPGECATTADCSPNHLCQATDYGYSTCQDDPNPTCVNDPAGVCRLRCQTDADCLDGGGCRASDGLCHASNECVTSADCPSGQICYPRPEFGGLCGPSR